MCERAAPLTQEEDDGGRRGKKAKRSRFVDDMAAEDGGDEDDDDDEVLGSPTGLIRRNRFGNGKAKGAWHIRDFVLGFVYPAVLAVLCLISDGSHLRPEDVWEVGHAHAALSWHEQRRDLMIDSPRVATGRLRRPDRQ